MAARVCAASAHLLTPFGVGQQLVAPPPPAVRAGGAGGLVLPGETAAHASETLAYSGICVRHVITRLGRRLRRRALLWRISLRVSGQQFRAVLRPCPLTASIPPLPLPTLHRPAHAPTPHPPCSPARWAHELVSGSISSFRRGSCSYGQDLPVVILIVWIAISKFKFSLQPNYRLIASVGVN